MTARVAPISRRSFLVASVLTGCARNAHQTHKEPSGDAAPWIGYTEYRTNLPTRHANQVTSRACVVRTDGSDRRELAPSLIDAPNTWTQFAGWSPDGSIAIVGRGWESPENAAWEEEHKTFRMTEGWLFDIYFLDMKSNALSSLTEIERVSAYNSGVFFIPESDKLGFTALIDGVSHPFVMDRDGRNKRDVSSGEGGFAYGFSASPDGSRITYHENYQIYVANADGSNARKIETGNPFNFVPQWSPDGTWLMFVSGEHHHCHPYIVRPDGSGLRKIADRGGYEGFTTVYDVYDFHNGSSDVPVWSEDGKWIYYTTKIDNAIELMRVSLDGNTEQLTRTAAGFGNYHPKPSPDGKWLAFGSNRTGTRQLYVMPATGGETRVITNVPPGHGAMWAHWQPKQDSQGTRELK